MDNIKKAQRFLYEKRVECVIVTNMKNIRYISGFSGSSAILILLADKAILLTDFRYIEQAQVEAPTCEIFRHGNFIYEDIADFVQDVKEIAVEENHLTLENFKNMRNKIINKNWHFLNLNGLRMIKNDEEIINIKKAVEIADKAFEDLLPDLSVGMTEIEAGALLEYNMRKNGAEGTSFSTIVASGKRSSLPHGQPTTKKFAAGDFATFDFGAIYKGYCSDMTRTVVFGNANEKQKEIYNIVLKAQLAVIDKLKSGMKGKDGDKIARDIIVEAGYGNNFGHGTGHSLGLFIHEDPRLAPSCETVLLKNMLVTVEPGIYIPDWGGVRIEDIVLITDNGNEVLTKTTKKLIEIK